MKVYDLVLELTGADLIHELPDIAASGVLDREVIIENDFGDEETIKDVKYDSQRNTVIIQTEE